MAWFLGAYRDRGGRNLGIRGCRHIAGTTVLSVHADGRAVDLGVPVGASWAQGLANSLVARSRELGVQCVIYNRRIWSSSYCRQGWRPYSGTNPHRDHLHVEVTPAGSEWLTVARINATMGADNWTEKIMKALPTLRTGATGADVKRLQALLAAVGHPPAGSFSASHRPDGKFGAKTVTALKAFQKAQKITVDGVAGRATWAALLD